MIRRTKQELMFSKTTKLHEPIGQVQFVVIEQFTSAYHTKYQGAHLKFRLKGEKGWGGGRGTFLREMLN